MSTEAIIRTVLIVIHIVFATLWLGPTLGLPKSVGRALDTSREALGLAIKDFDYRGLLAAIGGVGVILTGVGMMFYTFGGFKGAPIPFHIALGLAILAAINSAAFGKGAKVFKAAHANYDEPHIAAAKKAVKRVSLHAHVSETLWLGALVLMIVARNQGT